MIFSIFYILTYRANRAYYTHLRRNARTTGGDWSEYRKRILNLARSRPDVRVVIVRLSNDDEKKFKKDVEKDKKHNKEARAQFHASIGGRGGGRNRRRRRRGWK